MADVALFSDYRVIYQKGVAGITCQDYRVKFWFRKELGKETKMLTINLDKGVVVKKIGRF
jgi:putative lipoprotein